MKHLLSATLLTLASLGAHAQCRLNLKNYRIVLDESFDNLTHPSQLSSRWQFTGDDALATFGGGEYYIDPTTNNFANLELRTEVVGGVSTKYLRLKSVQIQGRDSDFNQPIWNLKRADGTSWNNNGRATFRSTLLMTKRGVSAGPSPAPFDLSDDPGNPNSASRGFLYGAFEVRMRLDSQGSFPAFWLYGDSTDPLPGPAYWEKGIQLNIFEGGGYNYRSDNSYSVMYDNEEGYQGQSVTVRKNGNPLSDDFHTYTGVWTPDQITFFFDGREVATFTGPANTTNFIRNIRNRPAQIIASLQMFPWHNQDAHLDIDYIKVYKSNVAGNPYPAYKSTTEWMYTDVLKNTTSAVPAVTTYGGITLKNDPTTPRIYYHGTDNYLYQATLQNGTWLAQQVPYNYTTVANSVLLKGDVAYSAPHDKIFFIGQDNRLQYFGQWNGWYHSFADTNWNSGAELGSAAPGSLVAANDGRIIYRGQDDKIHIFEYSSNGWAPAATLANSTLSYSNAALVQGNVSVAANGQIFWVGRDSQIHSLTLNPATNQYALGLVGAPLAVNPPLVASGLGTILPVTNASNQVDLYYIGSDGLLSAFHPSGTGSNSWQYESIPYAYGSSEYPATSLVWEATTQRILYIGTDGRVQYLHNNSGIWEHNHIDTYRAHSDFVTYPAIGQSPATLLAANDGNAVYYQAGNGTLSSFAWGTCQVTNPSNLANPTNDPTKFPVLNRTATNVTATTAPQTPQSAPGLSLYPNPVATSLHVQFDATSSGASRSTVYNLMGQPVLTFPVLDSAQDLDVSQLPAGLYLLVVQQGKSTYRAKFTKL